MDSGLQLLKARVAHRRPKSGGNAFRYRVYYLVMPLPLRREALAAAGLRLDRAGLHSVYQRDHGPRDGGDLYPWIADRLAECGLYIEDGWEVLLVAMPRVLGYVFNPISFWLCLDGSRRLRAVLCEVNNTFGETHCYLCMHADRRPIGAEDLLQANKLFHVSPFLQRNGHYRFRFDPGPERLAIRIDYFDETGEPVLLTSLAGHLVPLSRAALLKAFCTHPLVTLKAISRIHWQALKLWLGGESYVPKPKPLDTALSLSSDRRGNPRPAD